MKKHILILTVCFLAQSLSGQQFPFRNYTVQDGLSQINIRTIFQDSQGFMWFGTWNGVNRYDGSEFKHFTVQDGLAHYLISHITEDRNGNIWIATSFAGISKYRDGTFQNYTVNPTNADANENRVRVIAEREDGTLFVGTDAGTFIFDGEQFIPQAYNIDLRPHVVFKDSRNLTWITSGQSVCVLRDELSAQCIIAEDIELKWITTLTEDSDGTIWIGSENGLRMIKNIDSALNTFIIEKPPPHLGFLAGKWIRSLFVDRDRYLWIGTGGFGLFNVSTDGSITHYTTRNGLAGNQILSIYQDREGNLWFATTTGVSKLVSKQFTNYTILDDLPEPLVQCILEDNNGNIWIGTRLGLCMLRQNSIDLFTIADGLKSNYLLDLYKDTDGTVWAGTEGGVNKITSTKSNVTIEAYGEEHGWHTYRKTWENRSRVTYRDLYGNLWFGNDIGIALLKDNRFIQYQTIDYQDRDLIVGIVMDDAGYLWVARFNSGISRYSLHYDNNGNITLEEQERYGVNNGLKTDRIQSILKDRDDNLWFPTRHQGVYRFVLEDGTVSAIHNYTTANGLLYNLIHVVFEDSKGRIWIGGGGGVDQVEIRGDTLTVTRQLTMNDGLAGETVIDITEDMRGNIWFGTSGGATRYDPNFKQINVPPPPVHITEFRIFGETKTEELRNNTLRLPYDQHSVSFEFTGLSFKDEKRVRYRYILEGFDRDWSEVTSRRYVNYTHLPSGKYVFKVIAQNGDGVWSESPAAFAFTINAPFYKTWWFILLTFMAIAGLVFAIHNYRLKRAIEIERMRSRIATDLHDDIGSTLSGISVFSEMGIKETEENIPHAADLFQRISESSLSMLDAMDDIVWAINPENDSLETLIIRMREFATEILEAKHITFTLDLPTDSYIIKLSMHERKNLYLIFKEGIHNLVKHSRCYSASVGMKIHDNTVTLRITDDGIGFDPVLSNIGNGLKNMRKRADSIGAAYSIESEIGKGTTITVQLRIT
jgi:ligand-binding sensor domain-containing protein